MTKISEEFHFDGLIFTPISLDNIDVIYEAFVESFQELNKYYLPAWSRYEALPSKKILKEYWDECVGYFENKESFLFSVFDKETNRFIGHAEIHHFDPSVPKGRLGYWVRNSESGKGYATKFAQALTKFGFETLECQRLEIRNDVRHIISGKIAKKLGYKFLTIFEKNKQGKKDDFWDLEIHALLKDEYHDQS